MIMTPGSWASRLSALALLVLLLLAAYHLILSPALGLYQANQQQIVQKSDLLQRYQRLAAAEPGLREQLAEIDDQGQPNSGYWAGPSDALAAAQMQDLISDVIEAHGGQLISVQTQRANRPEDGSSTRQAALDLRLSATIDDLAKILTSMETATPYIFIDRLVASPRRTRRADDETIGEPELDVRLEAFGYLQNGEMPQASASKFDAREFDARAARLD